MLRLIDSPIIVLLVVTVPLHLLLLGLSVLVGLRLLLLHLLLLLLGIVILLLLGLLDHWRWLIDGRLWLLLDLNHGRRLDSKRCISLDSAEIVIDVDDRSGDWSMNDYRRRLNYLLRLDDHLVHLHLNILRLNVRISLYKTWLLRQELLMKLVSWRIVFELFWFRQ